MARPAIAEYRIISYDGEMVKFWYEDHKTGEVMERELRVLDFIGKIIMHIPKKNFKMVRRYGLYRRDLNKISKKSVELQLYYKGKSKVNTETGKKTWKQRIIDSFGKNPIKCPKCGKEMELWEIWNEKSGTIYHIFYELKTLKEEPRQDAKKKEPVRHNSLRRSGGDKTGCVQISLQRLCI